MTIANPDITETDLDAVADLRDKLKAVMLIGQVCHCCRIQSIPGQPFGSFLVYRDDDGREHNLGYWNFGFDVPGRRVIMRRRSQNEPLAKLFIPVGVSDAALADTLIDAVEEIRTEGGVVTTQADLTELEAALLAAIGST